MSESPNFEAMVVTKQNANLQNITLNDLSTGDVVVKVDYSSLNYKDMLAFQPDGGILRSYPMIPGIDLSGRVVDGGQSSLQPGTEVLVTSYGLGVSHTGGLAEYARVPSEWVVPLPKGLSRKMAMVIGTAGFTAMRSIEALQQAGMTSDSHVVVTGVTGGVGSIALTLLKQLHIKTITAVVHRYDKVALARSLGADEVILASSLESNKLLNSQRFDFALDTVGGNVTKSLLPSIAYGGAVTVCGNAAGIELNTSMFPFILRAVQLIGIDSVNVPMPARTKTWQKLAEQPKAIESLLYDEVTLKDVPDVIEKLRQGGHIGRTIVTIGGE